MPAATPNLKPQQETAAMPTAPSQAPIPAPYRQPFANPARNSAEPVAVAPGAPAWQPSFTADATLADATLDWLLGGGAADDVLAFESVTGRAFLVDLGRRRKPAPMNVAQGAFPAFQEDADQLVLPRKGLLMLPDMTDPGDYDRFREVFGAGLAERVHALIARREHFTALSLRPPNHAEQYTVIQLTSKPYADDAQPTVRWQHYFKHQVSAPSPALSDDTLIVCREGGLAFFAPDGAGFVDPAIGIMQGKVLVEVTAQLRAGLVSADLLDRVWGFRVEDGALVGWDRSGQSLGAPLPLDVSAVQPPVALPGGALAVIAPGVALKIDQGKVQWRAELPPSAQPLATADRDGKLLVRAGKQLVLIDEQGKRVWQSELPAEITSNPLITNGGRLCVAAGLTLYCSQ